MSHGPADLAPRLAAPSFSAASIAAQLAAAPVRPDRSRWEPMQGDAPAAVLVALVAREDRIHTLLTRRHAGMRQHAGEWSFPGGRPESGDVDAAHTATREACEEIGLDPHEVEIVGSLPTTTTYVTGYAITPVVAIVRSDERWSASDGEVSEVIEPALEELRTVRTVTELRRPEMDEPLAMPAFPLADDRHVWGATARILDDLLVALDPLPAPAG